MEPQKTSLRFSKEMRVKNRLEFQIFKDVERRAGSYICINQKPSNTLSKLGITASRKYGSSVERNRFKRRVREAFRHLAPHIKHPILVHVIPRQKAKQATMQNILKELSSLLGQ